MKNPNFPFSGKAAIPNNRKIRCISASSDTERDGGLVRERGKGRGRRGDCGRSCLIFSCDKGVRVVEREGERSFESRLGSVHVQCIHKLENAAAILILENVSCIVPM